MEKTVETVRSNFNSIRTGRASPAMLDKIEVRHSVGSPPPFTLVVNMTIFFITITTDTVESTGQLSKPFKWYQQICNL